jgi:hypothetical protein
MLATLVNAEVSVTASTTLTATAFGKLHVCSGTTADYTVGLPAVSGNAGKFIGFRMAPGLTKFVTLDANASELIDGATTRIMWANETAILYCDGSAWTKVAGRSIPLICGMYPTTSVTVLSATQTAVNLSGVIQDNSGGMAETASNRMRIKRPGTYRVNANCYYQAGSNTMNTIQCLVPKNGTATNVGSETIWQTIAAAEAFRVRYIDDVLGLVAGDTVSLTANQTGGTRSLYVNDPTWTYLKLSEVPSW